MDFAYCLIPETPYSAIPHDGLKYYHMDITRDILLSERLHRQRLLEPATTADDYTALFALLQPVSPFYFSYPGSPPTLVHRTAFDERAYIERLRERREVVKGRFLSGTIGYVQAEELALYANAFRRPLEKLGWMHRRIFEALEHTGPLTPRQISEETNLLNKEVMPALHRLQEAFLVYEDQLTTDWERGWYVFTSEWPEVTLDEQREESQARVLARFFTAHVFATASQLKDWTGLPVKVLQNVLTAMEREGDIAACQIPGMGEGWIDNSMPLTATPAPPTVFMLHKTDPLVRAQASELKKRFAGLEVLQYLLIDGDFQGAVAGHWRIGPHDVDDIVLELPQGQRAARREEILQAVSWGYQPPFSHILRFDGQAV